MKRGPLIFGHPSLARHDCPKCKTKNSLFRKNVCIHCKFDRGISSPVYSPRVTLTQRQKAHVKLMDHKRRHLIKRAS